MPESQTQPTSGTAPAARFGAFRLIPGHGLFRRGRPVPLPQKQLRLLELLVERAGQAVSREEIRRHLWRGRVVTYDQILNGYVRDLRSALTDAAAHPRYIRTLPKIGYVFCAPVRRDAEHKAHADWRWLGAATTIVVAIALIAMPDKPDERRLEARAIIEKAEYLLQQAGADEQRLAAMFEQALNLSDEAAAHVGLAKLALRHDDVETAMNRLETALAANRNHAVAWALRGRILFHRQWRFADAEAAFKAARDADSRNLDARIGLARIHVLHGDAARALEEVADIESLLPVDAGLRGDLGWLRYLAHDFDGAITACEDTLLLAPGSEKAARCFFDVHLALGNQIQSAKWAIEILRSRGVNDESFSEMAAAEVLTAFYRYELDYMRGLEHRGVPTSVWRAMAHLGLGEKDEAIQALTHGLDAREPMLPFVAVAPPFRALRGDARFDALLAKIFA